MTGDRAPARTDDTPVPTLPQRPRAATLTCRRCGTSISWDDPSRCTWWPNGCTARQGELPRPTSCWDCLTEDERVDLVDAGCHEATLRARGWR